MATVEELVQERDFRSYVKSPSAFMNGVVKIKIPGKGLVPLELRETQEEALGIFQDERMVCVLKARQIGWTTLTTLYALWLAMFTPNTTIILLSRTQAAARKSLTICWRAYAALPDWLKDRVVVDSRNQNEMKFANGSIIESQASRENAARGDSADLIVVDELAFFKNPEDAWAAIEPAFEVGGRVICISTANGYGNFFQKLYTQGKSGENGFKTLFYGWNAATTRDEEWFAEKVRTLESWQRAQEYPSDDEECFVRSGIVVYSTDMLMAMEVMKPVHVMTGMDTLNHRPVIEPWPDEDAGGRMYEDVVNYDPELRRGHGYVLGVDVALGTESGDYSTIHVIDRDTLDVVYVHECRVEPVEFSTIVYAVGKYYNNAFVGIERNNHGATVVAKMRDMGYRNMYSSIPKWKIRHEHGDKHWGWTTTPSTKPRLVDQLGEALNSGEYGIRDERTLIQLRGFTRRVSPGGGTITFFSSPHDDLVISLAIAVIMIQSAPPIIVKQEEPQGPSGKTLAEYAGIGRHAVNTRHRWAMSRKSMVR